MPKRHRPAGSDRPAPADSGAPPHFRVRGRVWVEADGATYLAWGRVVLLERIRDLGSITKAARSMGMGYRRAWDLVEAVNREAPVPLVERTVGGRGGGGTRVTPAGEQAIAQFWDMVRAMDAFLAGVGAPGAHLDAEVDDAVQA